MKRIIGTILCIIIITVAFPMSVFAVPQYGNVWNGKVTEPARDLLTTTADDPYIIETPEQLAYFGQTFAYSRQHQTGIIYLKLAADLYINDVSDFDLWGRGLYGIPMPELRQFTRLCFTRMALNGNGHTIFGSYGALFYDISYSTVKNLKISKYYCTEDSFAVNICGSDITTCCMEGNAAQNSDGAAFNTISSGYADTGVIIRNFYTSGEKYIIKKLESGCEKPVTVANCCNYYAGGVILGSFHNAEPNFSPSFSGCYSFGDNAAIQTLKTEVTGAAVINCRTLSHAESLRQSSYAAFDFVNDWQMIGGVSHSYPSLRLFQKNPAPTGDLNGDGNINAVDVFRIRFALSGKSALDNVSRYNADIYRDGKVNVLDVLRLKLILAGKA